MAIQDPPMNTVREQLQGLNVYETAKEYFLGAAKMLKRGFSPPVSTDELGIVITPMPSGQAFQRVRYIIESSLQNLHMRLSQQSIWEMTRIISADRTEFFIILYRSDAFSSSREKAVQYAVDKRLAMRELEYTSAEVEDTIESIEDTIKRHFLGLAKLDKNLVTATDYTKFVSSRSIGGNITTFYISLPVEMAKNGHGIWVVAIFPPWQDISFTIAYCIENFASKEEAFEYMGRCNEVKHLTYTDDELKGEEASEEA